MRGAGLRVRIRTTWQKTSLRDREEGGQTGECDFGREKTDLERLFRNSSYVERYDIARIEMMACSPAAREIGKGLPDILHNFVDLVALYVGAAVELGGANREP